MRISDWSSDVCSSDLERQRAQVRERAVAGAEIVEREADALVLEAADDRLREREIVEQRTFGDLDLEPRGRIAGLGEQFDDLLRQPGVAKLPRRNVDRQAQRRIPRSEEHTSELQSLMRISYAVFCLK